MGDYATLAEVQTRAPNLIKTSTFEDIITALLPPISRLIDRYMRREDDAYDAPAVATTKQFNGNGEEELFIDECVAVTAVEYLSAAATWTAWAATDYQTLGHDGTPNTLPICSLYVDPYGNYGTWPEGVYNIRVTANWGWSAAIPELVKLACVEHAIYSFKQLQQGMQETGGLTELGMVELIPPLCKAALAMLDQMPKKAR